MTSPFRFLNDSRFNLRSKVNTRFVEMPVGPEIRLARRGFVLHPDIKKKAQVYPDMMIAEHPDEDRGNLYSPVRGEVVEISQRFVIIQVKESEPDDPVYPGIALSPLEGEELVYALKNMGVDTRHLSQCRETLIINALNPEPGIQWAEPMLAVHLRNLKAGLELHQRISCASNVILALPKGMNAAYPGMQVVYVDPTYPNSLDPILVKTITGKENPDHVGTVGIHTLWGLGRVAVTGRPLTETVVTLSTDRHVGNYLIKDGTRVEDLLGFAGVRVDEGDTVVVGGPLRGASISLLARGLDKETTGLFVIRQDSIPPLQGDSQCSNCGACVLSCPARLSPNMLSRYAEFARYDKCRDEHIDACIECGLCGYVCVSRRPVLQYIRLAKHKLALEDNRIG